MGQDIQSVDFTPEEIELFRQKLHEETKILKSWFDGNDFSTDDPKIGIELEGWLKDCNSLPSPVATDFLQNLNHKQIVPEISKFNFEINSNPYDFKGSCFKDLSNELKSIWNLCHTEAQKHDSDSLLIGTLATLRPEMLRLEYLSPNNRYSVMNNQIMRQRDGKPLRIHLSGKDEIKLDMDSVIAECAATSLQIHLGVNQENAARYYNASLLASPFLVAISANSPYFFGKELWDESRIVAFEQSVELKSINPKKGDIIKRVTLGSSYIEDSLFELFEENIQSYPLLLPEVDKAAKPEELKHLKLHNGTIWRWTRPIIGDGPGDKKHLRIEQRTPSSGPTIDDSIANSVFFLGLCDYFAKLDDPLEKQLSFLDNSTNFYLTARQSLYCRVEWIDGKKHDVVDLIKHQLIPGIKECLKDRGVDAEEIKYYIDYIIMGRLNKGINGARWQKAWIHCHGKKFQELMEVYSENQLSGKPVHEWSI